MVWVCEWISKGENCLGMCERCQSHREIWQHLIQMTVVHMDRFAVLLAKSVAFCLWTWKEEDISKNPLEEQKLHVCYAVMAKFNFIL